MRKAAISFVTSVRPHGTTRLPLDGFSWNLIFEDFSKLCRENSCFIKIGQERRVLYMKTYIHFSSYISQFFLEWEMFQTKNCRENPNTYFVFSKVIFRKSCHLWGNAEKYSTGAGHRRQYGACALHAAYLRLPKHTLRLCNIAFQLQQWSHERASMLRYTYIVCLFFYVCHPVVLKVIIKEVKCIVNISSCDDDILFLFLYIKSTS